MELNPTYKIIDVIDNINIYILFKYPLEILKDDSKAKMIINNKSYSLDENFNINKEYITEEMSQYEFYRR